jgi:hypothetical protein
VVSPDRLAVVRPASLAASMTAMSEASMALIWAAVRVPICSEVRPSMLAVFSALICAVDSLVRSVVVY